MKALKVVLVDDHQLVLDGLSDMLEKAEGFDVVMTFNDPAEALRQIPRLEPDLLMTDLEMPGLTGEELITRLREQDFRGKCILLTMYLDQATVKRMMELDVDAYLLKNSDREEFMQALLSVARGKKYYSSRVTEALIDKGKELKRSSSAPSLDELTDRERDVLKCIAEGSSTKEIAEELFISVSTVETHRKALLRKLDVKNVAGLVRIAVQSGLV
jgi:DNA-binding NarL/FixJ family response regulator